MLMVWRPLFFLFFLTANQRPNKGVWLAIISEEAGSHSSLTFLKSRPPAAKAVANWSSTWVTLRQQCRKTNHNQPKLCAQRKSTKKTKKKQKRHHWNKNSKQTKKTASDGFCYGGSDRLHRSTQDLARNSELLLFSFFFSFSVTLKRIHLPRFIVYLWWRRSGSTITPRQRQRRQNKLKTS